jgi:phosphoglycerate dehydrogenase-like enzyme
MKDKILVTDTLFIADEHVKQLEDAGYEVERLEKADATEDELIEALKDKTGYILGGIEKVTDRVLESTDTLKAISFTGADWKALITGWETAKKKGIMITNAPGANAPAVAEFAIGMTLLMQRNMLEIGRTGDVQFQTTPTLHNAVVGVIGAGHIGSRIIKSLATSHPQRFYYHTRNKNEEVRKRRDTRNFWTSLCKTVM